MSYVNSVNGKINARMESPEVAGGVLVPRIVYLDSDDVKMTDGRTIRQGLSEIAQMRPEKIEGAEEDYLLIIN